MKKYLTPTIFCSILFLFSNAQKINFEYGLHGGINIGSANGNAISKDYKSVLIGPSFGGHVKLNVTNEFGIKVLAQYDQYGWMYRSLTFVSANGTDLVKGNVLHKLNYLNLPVLAEYSYGSKIKFNINAGIFLGIPLSNKIVIKYQAPLPANQPSTTESSSDYYKKMNFGISVGTGLQVPVTKKLKLDFGVSDNYGLSNIYKSQTGSGNVIKTNAVTISTGFTISM
ncbi:MAG: PorT family protein [Chitinophagaceae bacterium]|nr:PorT family protein [Chitinophagaceae bacterium]